MEQELREMADCVNSYDRPLFLCGMKWLLTTYTARFNRKHKLFGHLFSGSAQKKAERILAEELQRRGWDQSELQRRRKGDPEKLAIARRLRTETTMTLAWMAGKLSMGAPGALANCLRNKLR
jgi:hypothetical protein